MNQHSRLSELAGIVKDRTALENPVSGVCYLVCIQQRVPCTLTRRLHVPPAFVGAPQRCATLETGEAVATACVDCAAGALVQPMSATQQNRTNRSLSIESYPFA